MSKLKTIANLNNRQKKKKSLFLLLLIGDFGPQHHQTGTEHDQRYTSYDDNSRCNPWRVNNYNEMPSRDVQRIRDTRGWNDASSQQNC